LRTIATVLMTALVLVAAAYAAVHFGLLDVRVQDPSLAQQAAAQATAPESPAAAEPTPTPAPSRPAAAQPQMIDRQTYGDWIYGCFAAPDGGGTRCSIDQSLLNADTRNLVFFWRIIENGQGGLAAILRTPDSVMLRAGIRLNAGTPEPIVIPFDSCGRGLCQATGTIAPDFLQTLSTTEQITATLVAQNGQAVTLQVGVDGLAEALAALDQTQPGFTASAPPPSGQQEQAPAAPSEQQAPQQ